MDDKDMRHVHPPDAVRPKTVKADTSDGTRPAPRLLLVLAVLLLAGGLAAGCWDKREAEDLAYVRATVVDCGPEGGVRILAQVPNPRAIGGGIMAAITPGVSVASKPYRNYVADGRTIFEAIRRMSLASPRRLFWGQNALVVFCEGMAREGLAPHLDFFERSQEIRRRLVSILITPSDPYRLFDIPGTHEPAPAGRIERIIEHEELSSRFAVVSLSEFFRMLAAEGQEAYCGVVRMRPNPARPSTAQQPEAPEPDPVLELSGAAAFRGDRLAGYLDERETRGLLWVRNKVRGGEVTAPGPSGGYVTLEVGPGKARIIPAIREGRLLATLEVKGVDALVAESESPLDLTRPEAVRALEKALVRGIEDDMLAAAARAQTLGSDVLGVGAAFHRKYPDEWREMKENWPEIFPTVEITAHAEASIRRTGFIERGMTIKN